MWVPLMYNVVSEFMNVKTEFGHMLGQVCESGGHLCTLLGLSMNMETEFVHCWIKFVKVGADFVHYK